MENIRAAKIIFDEKTGSRKSKTMMNDVEEDLKTSVMKSWREKINNNHDCVSL